MTTFNGENASLSESELDINLVTLISVVNLSKVVKPVTRDEATCACSHGSDRDGWRKRALKD